MPAGYTPDGGEVIHDYYVGENPDHNWGDRDPSDLAAYVAGTAGGDLIASGLNDDLVRGNGGNDLIWGGDGNDLVYGQTGNDTLYGNAGNDTLNRGAGSDRLIGGAGRDVLWGGNDASRDTFVFSALIHSKVGAQRDVIQDFQHGVDVIELTTLDSNVSVAGNQNFLFGGATAIANGVWYGSANGGVIVRGDINGDKVADFEIFVANVTSVTATDFLL
ncbi:M10 family metallopeptidase C-terminal domain-containing protein [Paracoccus cavernae]|uniref:M10 family metallopeptidase C-terminal domain-containing protein n=1 Tax=Paracoccus cavernae TaxID=1571207 RepID=A0ABT8D9B7_9RHOB|nr:M10 family metallopeptidase C-terminal domain-containing protein [Paracoccus cavernae]